MNNEIHLSSVRLLRSYTITSEDDNINIENGRCPKYALDWNEETHKKHWSEGHNYIVGNNNNEHNNSLKKCNKREKLNKKLNSK